MAGDLDKDDFTVEEDGSEVAIEQFYFTGSASGQKLDLAVVFDNTNSMLQEIDAMKLKVKDLTDSVDAAGIDARYSLISFGNDVSVRIELSDDPIAFKREVDALYVISGVDDPENPLDAIEAVISMGFRPDAQKVILVITDDYAHQRDDDSGISNYTKEEVEADLEESGVIFVVVSPQLKESKEYVDMKDVAEDTHSIWIDVESEDFSAILEQFKGMLTGSYVIEYTSPSDTATGSRNVYVSVNAPECVEGGASSSYIAPTSATFTNEPPIIIYLISNKTSPQPSGSIIAWTIEAEDPDGDEVLYKFFLDYEPLTNWVAENTWTWKAPENTGTYRIEAQVRDGTHAGPNGMDDRMLVSFEIIEQNNPPVINDLIAAQDKATEITWTASASDPDGDQILYKFYLNGKSMTEWTNDNKWDLNTVYANVGENEVKVQIRDGYHSDPESFDGEKSIQFKLSSMKLMVQTWIKTIGEGAAISVQHTSDGGYVIAGGSDNYGAWLAKTDDKGNRLWYKTFGGGSAWEVQQTSDGGYIIAGDYPNYAWLIKTDANGNKLWERTLGKGPNALGASVKQTNDGGYILAGWTTSFFPQLNPSDPGVDVFLIKTDANGYEVWNKTFGGSKVDLGYSVLQIGDGGYILSGYTQSYGIINSYEDFRETWLIKTDSVGNKEWDKILPGYSGCKVRQTRDGGYIVGGTRSSASSLIKTNSIGNIEWVKFSNSLDTFDVQQTRDGGYVTTNRVSIETESADTASSGDWDPTLALSRSLSYTTFLIKIDTSGNEEWRKEFPNYPNANWLSILQADDGGYILAGENNGYATLLKTDANGNL